MPDCYTLFINSVTPPLHRSLFVQIIQSVPKGHCAGVAPLSQIRSSLRAVKGSTVLCFEREKFPAASRCQAALIHWHILGAQRIVWRTRIQSLTYLLLQQPACLAILQCIDDDLANEVSRLQQIETTLAKLCWTN